MARHAVSIAWQRGEQDFLDNRYSRRHVWRFDGGAEVAASSSPHVVPLPMSDAAAVDPEEAFIAALSSCHMLWFLSIAAERQFRVDSYTDAAEGTMGRNARGKIAITSVTLRPAVVFSRERLPSPAEIEAMHHAAHDSCFLANSVACELRCEPVIAPTDAR